MGMKTNINLDEITDEQEAADDARIDTAGRKTIAAVVGLANLKTDDPDGVVDRLEWLAEMAKAGRINLRDRRPLDELASGSNGNGTQQNMLAAPQPPASPSTTLSERKLRVAEQLDAQQQGGIESVFAVFQALETEVADQRKRADDNATKLRAAETTVENLRTSVDPEKEELKRQLAEAKANLVAANDALTLERQVNAGLTADKTRLETELAEEKQKTKPQAQATDTRASELIGKLAKNITPAKGGIRPHGPRIELDDVGLNDWEKNELKLTTPQPAPKPAPKAKPAGRR